MALRTFANVNRWTQWPEKQTVSQFLETIDAPPPTPSSTYEEKVTHLREPLESRLSEIFSDAIIAHFRNLPYLTESEDWDQGGLEAMIQQRVKNHHGIALYKQSSGYGMLLQHYCDPKKNSNYGSAIQNNDRTIQKELKDNVIITSAQISQLNNKLTLLQSKFEELKSKLVSKAEKDPTAESNEALANEADQRVYFQQLQDKIENLEASRKHQSEQLDRLKLEQSDSEAEKNELWEGVNGAVRDSTPEDDIFLRVYKSEGDYELLNERVKQGSQFEELYESNAPVLQMLCWQPFQVKVRTPSEKFVYIYLLGGHQEEEGSPIKYQLQQLLGNYGENDLKYPLDGGNWTDVDQTIVFPKDSLSRSCTGIRGKAAKYYFTNGAVRVETLWVMVSSKKIDDDSLQKACQETRNAMTLLSPERDRIPYHLWQSAWSAEALGLGNDQLHSRWFRLFHPEVNREQHVNQT